jgi:hypothetical protein
MSESAQKQPRITRSGVIVLVIVVGALGAGLIYNYADLQPSIFPLDHKPLTSFATLNQLGYNETTVLLRITWSARGSYTPLIAQVNSVEYASAVIDLTGGVLAQNHSLTIPFDVKTAVGDLHVLTVYLSVHDNDNSSSFTLIFQQDVLHQISGPIN